MTSSRGAQDDGAPQPPRRLRLELTDPSHGVAHEDRPESWGDVSDEPRRLAEYEENRPPHHG